jgi:hypothetical protein
VPAIGLLAAFMVAACAGAAVPPGTAQPSSEGPAGPSSGASSLAEGTWTGTLTRHYTETTTTTSESDSTLVVVTYDATVLISSTLVDIGGWKLTGPATIRTTQTSDYKAHFTSTLGDCDKHYHDDDLAEGTSIVDGGLGISDDATYEFTVTVPGFDGGTETSLRDETGCQGSSNTEVNPWPVGPVNLEGSGEITDPAFLTGSTSKPIANGGQDTTTWSLRLSK